MDAFQREIVELLPRLRRFARTITRDHADADDLTQITVERALDRRDQWQPGTRLDSWMYRIMKNAWIDETRARGRRGKIFAPAEAGDHVGEDSRPAVEARIEVRNVERAMAQLPEEQRLAVALVFVEGLSYAEAAEVLEVPIGTLNSRLGRGRAALQAQFEAMGA